MIYQIKDIPNYPGYRIDTNGDVWSCRPRNGRGLLKNEWKKLRPQLRKSGYLSVVLDKKHKNIHRLMLLSFNDVDIKKPYACHNNGVRTDNRLENLRWDTSKNNNADRIIHGTLAEGEKGGGAKLTRFQVQRIRLMKEITPSFSVYKIAKMFQLDISSVYNILNRKTWKILDL